jgi:membrane associated rhomboid family serine protease
MGVGRDLGHQLRRWLEQDPDALRQSRALTNRLMDGLGAEESLRAPLRDLASQPLLLQVLHSQGAQRQSALSSLRQQLGRTYAPAIERELLDLLEAATGLGASPQAAAQIADAPPPTPPQNPAPAPALQALAPGLALAASGALVLCWAGGALDRQLLEAWGWSGGMALVVVLGLLQALSLGPLKALPRHWWLDSEQARDPHQAWRWLSSPWLHANGAEAAANLILLALLLGNSPLQLPDVVLRYCLTALACQAPAAALAQRWGVERRWSGASGPVSALIALAAGLSLLRWSELGFTSLGLSIPAWVLLLVYSALQAGWQLPRQGDDGSTPLQRLLCSTWTWGLTWGLAWALISWLGALH